jgi:hypothetical protein
MHKSKDVMSPSEMMLEEPMKSTRSDALYQQLPDKDGIYHCPEEGKSKCNHKPTLLKCRYE